MKSNFNSKKGIFGTYIALLVRGHRVNRLKLLDNFHGSFWGKITTI